MNMKHLLIDDQQHATIIAALRFYQQSGMGEPANRSGEIHDLATNGDEVISLDADGIEELVQHVNCAGDTTRVLITVSGGVASWVADEGVDVEKFDWDDFNASDNNLTVPAHFRDLAEPLNIPVEGDSDKPGEEVIQTEAEKPSDRYTEILQHRIKWWLRGGDDAPTELDDCSIEHIKKLIEDGYREGELCVTGNDGDTEYRGWWSIQFQ